MPTGHSASQYELELEEIHAQVLLMADLVENQVIDAIACFRTGHMAEAEKVIKADVKVNRSEISLDHRCSHLLVRCQPAAYDLRTIMATSKVITDLKRISDEAIKIARISKHFHQGDVLNTIDHVETIQVIGIETMEILRDALAIFAQLDNTRAAGLIARDKIIDRGFHAVMHTLITFMTKSPRATPTALDILWIAKALERIGDHAKNIAEYVIYIVDGKDMRRSDYAAAKLAELQFD